MLKRQLHHPFTLPWGKGRITEEVQIDHDHWAPVIQLLEYEDGPRGIRFCNYQGPRFQRNPSMWMEEDVEASRKQLEQGPKLRAMLNKLVKCD